MHLEARKKKTAGLRHGSYTAPRQRGSAGDRPADGALLGRAALAASGVRGRCAEAGRALLALELLQRRLLPAHAAELLGDGDRELLLVGRLLRLGSTRVIQRRFNVSVSRARVPKKASTLRDRSKR